MNGLDLIVLTHDIPAHQLQKDDVGTVIHVYAGNAYEVEFVTAEGATIAVLTLDTNDVRPLAAREILHARACASWIVIAPRPPLGRSSVTWR